jgi:hypothetical protein
MKDSKDVKDVKDVKDAKNTRKFSPGRLASSRDILFLCVSSLPSLSLCITIHHFLVF